jgi:phage-related protein
MPQTQVVFYQERSGEVPVLAWLKKLRREDLKAYANCAVAVERLAEHGHELRRPTAGYLRDGIYELRARRGHVNYRILYFFHGRGVSILAHAVTKEDKIPASDFQRAVRRKELFEQDPEAHSYHEEAESG